MKNETSKLFVNYLQNKGYTNTIEESMFAKTYSFSQNKLVNLYINNGGVEYSVVCQSKPEEMPENLFFVETERSDGETAWVNSPASFLIQEVEGRLYQIRLSKLKEKVAKLNPYETEQTWLPLSENKRGEYSLGYALNINELVKEGIAVQLI